MPIDKTLKVKAGGIKNRNVLKRAERVEKLRELEKFQSGMSVLGLPKVRVIKLAIKKKKKAKAEEGAEGDKAAAPAAAGATKPAAAAAAKPGGKPAGGAKK
jgi:small basic protein (TIGR04137 family)